MPYDVIIVGGGAAGLTAGMYAARRSLKTLILAKDLGGQAATTEWVENYPGIAATDGLELMVKFRDQAERFGAEMKMIEVAGIEKRDTGFIVRTPHESFLGTSVILASGLTPRDLGVPGEEHLKGRGVSYCVTCDGPLFRGQRVVVAGGGHAALDAAEYLTTLAREVHLIHERRAFHGPRALVEKVMGELAITKYLGDKIVAIKGDERVTAVTIAGSDQRDIPVDGVFVELGHIAKTDWLRGLVDLDAHGQVKTGRNCETSCSGIFAAGDVADIGYKQVVISAGEGAKAALQAYRYVRHAEGQSIVPDWTTTKPAA